MMRDPSTMMTNRRPTPLRPDSATSVSHSAAPASLSALALSLAICFPALAQPAGTPFIARTLLDHSLTSHAVLVHRIDGAMITYTDSRGLLRREPTSEFLALLPGDGPTGWQRRGSTDTLTLVDGQRFPGSILPSPDADEPPVLWDARFAHLAFPLERVSTLTRAGVTPPPRVTTGDDAVGLSNGDTITGFILGLGDVVVVETPGGATVEVSSERFAWARLANPPLAPEGAMLWLSDGTVACVETLPQSTPESLEARLLPPGQSQASLSEGDSPRISVPLASVRAFAFEPARLVGLGTLPLVETLSERPWPPAVELSDAMDEPLGAPDITLPAPMSAAWSIPPGATRLAFDATLPERSRLWGDAELVITLQQDGTRRALARARLHAGEPTASFNVQLASPADPRRERRLIIELVAGPTGPAHDTAVLHRPLLRIDGR